MPGHHLIRQYAEWMRRWRWLLLATAGLFGYADGSERGVSHDRLKAAC
jgi:cyclopropane-fatty-acyl-phospholipid synthase